MKRTYVFFRLVYHFTWGTKDHLPLITPAVEQRLFPYIGYKCKEFGYTIHAVNGTEDHIHLLVSLTPTMMVAEVVKNLKGSSSHYINKESGLEETLYWQDEYGVITIREGEIRRVVRYITTQKEHHQTGKISELLERTKE